MTESEKDLLRRIPSMRMEAQSLLRLCSYLLRNGKSEEREVNKWLDRIKYLDDLEAELNKKSN